jgi:hypothetical protein
MVEEEICPVLSPKMQGFLKHTEKMNMFQIPSLIALTELLKLLL